MDKPEPPYSLVTQEPTCSFCDQPASKVKKLIAGKRGLHICNYCVALCYDVLTAEGAIEPPSHRGAGFG